MGEDWFNNLLKMKRVNTKALNYSVFLFFCTLLLYNCNVNEEELKINKQVLISDTLPAKFEFEEKAIDLGTIFRGEVVETNFIFKNIGGQPLIINEAKASCGCTKPDIDRKPVLPGEEGKIKIIFDSNGLINNQYKTVTVTANTKPEETTLIIAAFVKIK